MFLPVQKLSFSQILLVVTSSLVTEAIGTVLFFYEGYFKYKKHKQKHLSSIQPNIFTSRKTSKQHSTKYF